MEKVLAKVLLRIGNLEGVVSEHGEDGIAIKNSCFDDYQVVTYLGHLLEQGEMEIKINPERVNVLNKFLHLQPATQTENINGS